MTHILPVAGARTATLCGRPLIALNLVSYEMAEHEAYQERCPTCYGHYNATPPDERAALVREHGPGRQR